MNIGLIIFIIVASILFALLEIQIEGQNGWAEKLPTWKVKNPFKKIINWPYITGYHTYLWLFLFIIFHFPLFLGIPFNFKSEVLILEVLFAILMLEDFMWFIFNPKWGIKKFFKEDISWHGKKFLFLPINYWPALIALVIIELMRRSV